MSTESLNRVRIDLSALRSNYQSIRKMIGGQVVVLAMVKSDAYGHGLVPCAKALAEAGAGTFGVAEVEEGVRLRQAGIEDDIIVFLGAPCGGLAEIVRYRLQPVVYDLEDLAQLSGHAVRQNSIVGCHLKIDLGMGRLGIMPEQLSDFVEALASLPGVYLSGFFSHFPLADADDLAPTSIQCQAFARDSQKVRPLLGEKGLLHIANSAAMLGHSASYFDMVRPGITLYGCYPAASKEFQGRLPLRPVMSFCTNVIQVKEIPAGHGISYGHLHITSRPTRLAVLPVGYDDGYLRRLTGKASVLIRGQRAPILGRICMNACMADVTDIPGVGVGDEVVLMGEQDGAGISADMVADWSDTISYEILCLFGGRNRRVYVD